MSDRPVKLNRRGWLLALPGASVISFVGNSFAGPEAQALLNRCDAIRNPGQPFRATVTLTEFDKGVQSGSASLVTYAKVLETGGQFATIMRFTLPARDSGKVMLKNGNDLWFYDPATKSAVRIAPQQRLLGQASNGDVVVVNFARDYKAEISGEEVVADGERRVRTAHKLVLRPFGSDATYGGIELWTDVQTQAPIKAKFFAESGRLLKTAFYRKFQQQLGADRPTETVIIDGLDPKSVTIVQMSDFAARQIPAHWFQRDHLAKFDAE